MRSTECVTGEVSGGAPGRPAGPVPIAEGANVFAVRAGVKTAEPEGAAAGVEGAASETTTVCEHDAGP